MLFLALCTLTAPVLPQEEAGFDVRAYRLDVVVDPETRRIDGVGYTRLVVTAGPLAEVVLDLDAELTVHATREVTLPLPERAAPTGREVPHARRGDTVAVRLSRPAEAGEELCVAVVYSGHPDTVDSFSGFHWDESADGRPWISTSVQGLGARSFWPCKDSFFHPSDKPDELVVNLTVPRGLVGVSNGRLAGRTPLNDEWETFHWVHPYPCETYAVTLNAGPFVTVERPLVLPGIERPVTFAWYVLPEAAEKAAAQFSEIPALLEVFSERFGPWPFPESKVGVVQTSFLGMEHTTALAYGSTFPSWCREEEKPDRMARRNRLYDYVLVHELAHEWWGNAVSARDWSHFWIHEGFGTFGEAVVVEALHGREAYDEHFDRMRSFVAEDARLYRDGATTTEEAYGNVIYVKGAWFLNTLRHYLDDDEVFWRAIREFFARFRYGVADTEDFRAVVEEVAGRSFERFFDEWFYGAGYPTLSGEVRAEEDAVVVDVANPVRHETGFHVPLDLAWSEDGERVRRRVWLEPGANVLRLSCDARPEGLEVVHLVRLLGKHDVAVRD